MTELLCPASYTGEFAAVSEHGNRGKQLTLWQFGTPVGHVCEASNERDDNAALNTRNEVIKQSVAGVLTQRLKTPVENVYHSMKQENDNLNVISSLARNEGFEKALQHLFAAGWNWASDQMKIVFEQDVIAAGVWYEQQNNENTIILQ